MRGKIFEAASSLLMAMIIVGLFGAGMDLLRGCDQDKRPESSVTAVPTAAQGPGYTGPAWCLEWGVGQPESCRGNLPECLAEDGSGPGVMCWFTDPDHGKLWLQYGDD